MMYAETQISSDMLKEGPFKKIVRPSQHREMARWAVINRGQRIRQACTDFQVIEICYRYEPKQSGQTIRSPSDSSV